MAKSLSKRTVEVLEQHRRNPLLHTQKDTMKKLRLGNDYQQFYRLFYRATIQKVKKEMYAD